MKIDSNVTVDLSSRSIVSEYTAKVKKIKFRILYMGFMFMIDCFRHRKMATLALRWDQRRLRKIHEILVKRFSIRANRSSGSSTVIRKGPAKKE